MRRGTSWTRSRRLGDDPWFRLGDRDLATHLWRTDRLRDGWRPTAVARELQARIGVTATVLPMTDAEVRTEIRTDDGWLEFQEYFVHRHQAPEVREVRFRGVETAAPTAEVVAAVEAADLVVIGPSNPIVSIGPILAVPGMTDLLAQARQAGTPIVAVSGIVGGRALKGPADRMLTSLGHQATAAGVAALLAPHIDGFVLDTIDADLESRDRRPRASNLHDRHDHERRRSEGQSRPRDARLRGIAPPARVCTIGLVTDDAGSPDPAADRGDRAGRFARRRKEPAW